MVSFMRIAAAKKILLIAGLLMVTLLAAPALVRSQAHEVNATIDTSKTGAPISKNIYGQFLEHGGDIVNTGVWSEMLVDRKFFYPVATNAPTPPAVMGNGAGNPRFRRIPTRWWAPIGGDDAVTMDTKAPYTGEQTPLIKVSGERAARHQAIRNCGSQRQVLHRAYMLAGSPGAMVKVTLIWGKDAADRQTVTIGAVGPGYQQVSAALHRRGRHRRRNSRDRRHRQRLLSCRRGIAHARRQH